MHVIDLSIFNETQALNSVFRAIHLGKVDGTDRINQSFIRSTSSSYSLAMGDFYGSFVKVSEGE